MDIRGEHQLTEVKLVDLGISPKQTFYHRDGSVTGDTDVSSHSLDLSSLDFMVIEPAGGITIIDGPVIFI